MQMTTKPAETGASISIPSVNRTAEKLRFSVPSALRAPAAGYLKRSAPEVAPVGVFDNAAQCWHYLQHESR
jgi:hypothetical protein